MEFNKVLEERSKIRKSGGEFGTGYIHIGDLTEDVFIKIIDDPTAGILLCTGNIPKDMFEILDTMEIATYQHISPEKIQEIRDTILKDKSFEEM